MIRWVKKHSGANFADLITEPGVARVLGQGPSDGTEGIRRKVMVSIAAHDSKMVALTGHHDCAGNPVSVGEHKRHIRRAVEVIASWGLGVQVVGLWVNNRWAVEVVCQSTRKV